jgi:hypothetical protein
MSTRDPTGMEQEDVISIHHGLNTSVRPWQLTVQMPLPITNVRNKAIALTELTMANSFFNITAALGNSSWSYRWIDSTVVNDTIPDGYYDVADGSLIAYLQSRMQANGHFLQPTSTTSGLPNMFFLNIVSLPTYYKCGLQLLAVPSTMPTGYQLPSGTYASPSWTLPSTSITPQITLPAPTYSTQPYLAQVLGVNAGTYPPTPISSTYQHNSDYCPQPTPIHCVQILCDSVSNVTNANNNMLYSFSTSKAGYLGTFDIEPSNLRWIPMRDFDALTQLTLSFVDGYGNPLAINDPSYNLTLVLRDGKSIY